jgi:hypothetical protein
MSVDDVSGVLAGFGFHILVHYDRLFVVEDPYRANCPRVLRDVEVAWFAEKSNMRGGAAAETFQTLPVVVALPVHRQPDNDDGPRHLPHLDFGHAPPGFELPPVGARFETGWDHLFVAHAKPGMVFQATRNGQPYGRLLCEQVGSNSGAWVFRRLS